MKRQQDQVFIPWVQILRCENCKEEVGSAKRMRGHTCKGTKSQKPLRVRKKEEEDKNETKD